MPAIDEAGRRLALSAVDITTLAAAVGSLDLGEVTDEEAAILAVARDGLEATGMLACDDTPHPLAFDLLDCIARPSFKLVVEVSGPEGERVSEMVVSGTRVWYDEPWPGAGPGAEVARRRSDIHALTDDLTRLAGVRPSGPPLDEPAVEGTMQSLGSTVSMLRDPRGSWDDRKAVVLAGFDEHAPVPEEARTRWITLLAALRASRRVTCFWGDPERHCAAAGVRGAAMLDCGTEGYWLRETPAEPLTAGDLGPQQPVRLRSVGGRDVRDILAALLPSGDELRALQAAAEAAR